MKKSSWGIGYIVGLVVMLCLIDCASTMSTYDQYAYMQTTSLKVEALALISKIGL